MKKNLLLLLLLPVLAAIAVPAGIKMHIDTYKVDLTTSKIQWFATKVTGKHQGTINMSSGEFTSNHGQLGGKFVIDMNTIEVTDLTGEYKGKLENHLKSEDFFSSTKFPTSNFEITSVTPIAGAAAGTPNFTVNGKLTIKGITNDISFPASVKFEGDQLMASGEAKVDRTKYDIRYGSKTFFADIGDKAIHDEFTLKVDVVAKR